MVVITCPSNVPICYLITYTSTWNLISCFHGIYKCNLSCLSLLCHRPMQLGCGCDWKSGHQYQKRGCRLSTMLGWAVLHPSPILLPTLRYKEAVRVGGPHRYVHVLTGVSGVWGGEDMYMYSYIGVSGLWGVGGYVHVLTGVSVVWGGGKPPSLATRHHNLMHSAVYWGILSVPYLCWL